MGSRSTASWIKYGCLPVLVVALVAAIVLGVASVVAVRQNRSSVFERRELVPGGAEAAASPAAGPQPIRLKLDVHTAGVSIKPIAAGASVRVDADYDPRLYVARQDSRRVGGVVVMTVGLRPRESTLMALLRAKLGGRPAMLHVALPRGVPLEIEGELARTFAVMELGGLALRAARLEVRDGGVKVSFAEPLPAPMERLEIVGNRGSLGVVGLGNASPLSATLSQHVGALDIDLRGAWSRDAVVRVIGGATGGSVWLPDNVRVEGLDERLGRRGAVEELSAPTLRLEISEKMGRVLVMD